MPHYDAPKNLTTKFFERVQNRPIRYAYTSPSAPARGLVLILPGSSEYIEKYHQTMHDLLSRGLAVACLDWQGHGLSFRGHDRTRRIATSFAQDQKDASAIIDVLSQLPEFQSLPLILLGHSMGAHLALRVMHASPLTFHSAALCAPMQGVAQIPQWLISPTKYYAQTLCALGFANHYLPFYGAWNQTRFEQNIPHLTSCPQNAAMQLNTLTQTPDLAMGGLTYSWLAAALSSMELTNKPRFLNTITTPILLAMAQNDKIVSNPAIKHTAKHLPNLLEFIEITGAQHEILMETPAIRTQFWQAFDNHIANRL